METKAEIFGKYILLEKIATGGMAEIYLAKSPGAENVSKFVAIKRILPQYSNNQDFIAMFKEEAKIAINLAHANVVSIIEFGIQAKLFFLAMQYVDGKNLRQVLNKFKKEKKYFSLAQIVHIVKESAKGLDHAHRCVDGTSGAPLNITHRDISPQNVMLSYEGEVRIIDFGIAKAESKIETTRAGTLKGKFGYMSPEQAEGYEVDFRTDIFSLGIVLWELLAQDRLFVANSEINTLKKIRECNVPSLRKLDPNIPQELERITMKALARDRTLRYQSAEEMAQDMQVFLNKHYPEFTSKDLAQSLKSTFALERDESRHKMIEYGKIQIPTDEKTEFVQDKTATVTETDGPYQIVDPTKTTKSNELGLKSKNNIKDFSIDFDRDDLVKSSRRGPHQTQSRIKNIQSSYHTQTGLQNPSTKSIMTSVDRSSWMRLFVYTLVAGSISYLLYDNTQFFSTMLSSTQGLIGSATNSSKIEDLKNDVKKEIRSKEAFYNLLVTSIPSGAEITVNDKKTNVFTPGQIRVPANKTYSLKLAKDDYHDETKSMMTLKQGEEIRITLKKKQLAYINVSVTGGVGAVYINGKKIADKGPVLKFPITADVPMKVQAYDKEAAKYAEKTIQIPANVVGQVNLNLEKRTPAAN